MFRFPQNLYVDVRVEETFTTEIKFKQLELQGQKVRSTKGAFVRVFDGERWYYGSTTDLAGIQAQIDTLAQMAKANPDVLNNPAVATLEVHQETALRYEQDSVAAVPVQEKQGFLEEVLGLIKDRPL